MLTNLVVSLLFPGVSSAQTATFRFTRPLECDPGWTRLPLPDDVLAACRPGLPDLRVRGADGADVPYALEQAIAGAPQELPLRDVESANGRETTAIVDRGEHPPLAAELTIEVDAPDLLKPVIVEASDDAAAWREIARGSIFATARARMTTLRFAPNDRRYLRLRLDDRNGPPVAPRAVRIPAVREGEPAPRTIPLPLTRVGGDDGTSVYEATLPSANLAVASLRFAPRDPAFARAVVVRERVLFRDEVTHRAVGGGTIVRGPGKEALDVPLGGTLGPTLEIAIDDGGSPPLAMTEVTAVVEPRSIVFFAPSSSLPLSLEYGSALASAPRYDLRAALAFGRPERVSPATLGPVVDRGAGPTIRVPPHGAAVDPAQWRTRAAIDLPPSGGVVYLTLDGIDASPDLRIVDASSRQVPYVVERAPIASRAPAEDAKIDTRPGRTTILVAGLASPHAIDAVELTADAPEYFSRPVTVVEATRDARGVVGERTLGSGTWQRRAGERPAPFVLPIAAPRRGDIEVRIDDGDNAPLPLGPVTIRRAVHRLDFVADPGDRLALLAGNPAATAPTYDLQLLADALLAAPAQPAKLEPPVDAAPAARGTPKWFWAVVIAAGLVVAAALARAMATRAAS